MFISGSALHPQERSRKPVRPSSARSSRSVASSDSRGFDVRLESQGPMYFGGGFAAKPPPVHIARPSSAGPLRTPRRPASVTGRSGSPPRTARSIQTGGWPHLLHQSNTWQSPRTVGDSIRMILAPRDSAARFPDSISGRPLVLQAVGSSALPASPLAPPSSPQIHTGGASSPLPGMHLDVPLLHTAGAVRPASPRLRVTLPAGVSSAAARPATAATPRRPPSPVPALSVGGLGLVVPTRPLSARGRPSTPARGSFLHSVPVSSEAAASAGSAAAAAVASLVAAAGAGRAADPAARAVPTAVPTVGPGTSAAAASAVTLLPPPLAPTPAPPPPPPPPVSREQVTALFAELGNGTLAARLQTLERIAATLRGNPPAQAAALECGGVETLLARLVAFRGSTAADDAAAAATAAATATSAAAVPVGPGARPASAGPARRPASASLQRLQPFGEAIVARPASAVARGAPAPTRLAEVPALLRAIAAACDHSPASGALIRSRRGIAKIVGMLGGAPALATAVLTVLHELVETDYETQVEFRLCGGVEKLLELLRSSADSEVRTLSAAAITSVCQENLSNVQCVVDGGGVIALLRLLDQRDLRLAHTAAVTLGFLCMQDASVRANVVSSGGLESLVSLLRAAPTDRTLNALAEVADAHPPAQHELRRLGALPLLARLLDAADAGLRQKAIVALATLCNGNAESCEAAAALGLVQRLTALLGAPETRNVAAMALATVCDRTPAAQAAAAAAVPALTAMLAPAQGDPLRSVYSASALRALASQHPANLSLVRAAEGLSQLAQLLHSSDAMMRTVALTALADLCQTDRSVADTVGSGPLEALRAESAPGTREHQQACLLLGLEDVAVPS